MTVNGDGDILLPSPPTADPQERRFLWTPATKPEETARYVDELFRGVEASKPKRLLIFVHGGLNTLATSTKRVNRLITDIKKETDYYPIFLNWDSGAWGSYSDHLFLVRQGEKSYAYGPVTSPFYFLADLGRAIARFPIVWGYTLFNDGRTAAVSNLDVKTNTQLIYECLALRYPGQVSQGRDLGFGGQTAYKVPLNIITFVPQLGLAPFIDGFGTPAWESMQRRAKVLFNKPDEFDIEGKPERAPAAIDGLPKPVMNAFMDRLAKQTGSGRNVEVVVIGHSMGAFIINAMLQSYPEMHFSKIVYMAGADSVRNTNESVVPYLRRSEHKETRFYNLTLHPQAEVEEATAWGLAPRGSLLVWIDNFFSTPHTHLDRTVGRWENVIPAYGEIPADLRSRIFMKAFDQDSEVDTHGSFSDAKFWRDEFWAPGAPGCNSWPIDPTRACPAERTQALQCTGEGKISAEEGKISNR